MMDNNNIGKKVYRNQSIASFTLMVMVLGIFILLITLFLVENKFKDVAYSNFGSFINGITAPIIGVIVALLTFLVFKTQIDVNEQIQKQFKLQQFESQFFKFLDVYTNLIDNIKYRSRFSDENFEGKNYFYLLHLEYKELLKDIDFFDKNVMYYEGEYITNTYFEELKKLSKAKKEIINKKEIYHWVKLELAYVIIYYGAGITGRENIKDVLKNKYDKKYLKSLLNFLSNIPKDGKCKNHLERMKKAAKNDFNRPNNKKFTKFYNGHQNRLGHYYRQLFGAIGYANKQSYIAYLDKWDYIRHFRSLFSNYEQLMFFINSVSILGRSWELDVKDVDENDPKSILNKGLITKYDLIKNIPEYYVAKYKVKKFYPNVDFNGYTVERSRLEEGVYTEELRF